MPGSPRSLPAFLLAVPLVLAAVDAQGIPGYREFGAGCGPAPVPKLIGTVPPYIGFRFELRLTDLPRLRVGYLFVGASNTTFGGVTLPQGLGSIGMPGCTMYASGEVLVPFSVFANGTVTWGFAVPANPALVGAKFYNQAFVFDPPANALGIVTTNAGEGTLLVATQTSIEETFADASQLDPSTSSGVWGSGFAAPGQVGGSGVLGEFDVRDGVEVAPGEYQWNTDSMVIPASRTATGAGITVTNGIFEFSHFHLAAGDTMVLVGSNPARFVVRGQVAIEGTIRASAPDVVLFSRSGGTPGQPGGPGAVGGGTGGAGGSAGNGVSNHPAFNGQDGEDVRLPAGHAYAARAAGTGGPGSHQFPVDGRWQSITFNGAFNFFSAQIAAGGGGGGGSARGVAGRALRTSSCPTGGAGCQELGPAAPGGSWLDLYPLPAGLPSTLDHFMVGGSGGGGGGSCSFWSSSSGATTPWWPGAGGAGGGGIVAFRAGSDLSMASGSSIEVRGGNANDNAMPPPAPGGGGSGGSCVLQVGGAVALNGQVDARGGFGGHVDENSIFIVETEGGDGGPGFLRLEAPRNLPVSAFGATFPVARPQNIGLLTDSDPVVGSQSLWYASGRPVAPTWLRYEVEARVNGVTRVYSDDPAVGSLAGPGEAVQLLVQGRDGGTVTAVTPWRRYVGASHGSPSLADDGAEEFRFQLLFDRSVAQSVVVTKVRVVFR